MLELLGPWAAMNAGTGLVAVVLFFMYRDNHNLSRDLRAHMKDEVEWRVKRDDWEKKHLTGHS